MQAHLTQAESSSSADCEARSWGWLQSLRRAKMQARWLPVSQDRWLLRQALTALESSSAEYKRSCSGWGRQNTTHSAAKRYTVGRGEP